MVQSFPPSKAVTTSLSPATTGDESPLGTATFHFTFFAGPISTGGFWPSATPDPPGPRNCGHARGFSAPRPAAANTAHATSALQVFMLSTFVVVNMVPSP